MNTITVSKNEYETLNKQAKAYKKLTAKLFELVIKDPIDEVVADFQQTNLYSDGFLIDLESGLRKSSYSNNHENQTLKKRSPNVS